MGGWVVTRVAMLPGEGVGWGGWVGCHTCGHAAGWHPPLHRPPAEGVPRVQCPDISLPGLTRGCCRRGQPAQQLPHVGASSWCRSPPPAWQLLGPYRPQTGGQPNCCGLLMPPRWRMVKVSTTNRSTACRPPPRRHSAVRGGDFNHPPPWRHQQAATVWLPSSLRAIWSKQLAGGGGGA